MMMKPTDELKYRIALSLLPNVGPVLARNLVSYCGSVEAVFKQKLKALEKIPEIGPKTAEKIKKHSLFARADEEVEFILKHNIQTFFYLDDNYPQRLKHCHDAPILLYFKGNVDVNKSRIIAIVGTRNASDYGKNITDKLIEELATLDVTIVSGLAYGIDIHAHRAALKVDIPTIAVMAHGLDRIYPSQHRSTAAKMLKCGGLLTEYPSNTNPDRENFPSRNRIVAGICDAVIVIEAAKKGGALITADIAHSYSRDVFAVPGRLDDQYSEGCNNLIKINRAALITSAADVSYLMGWERAANLQNESVSKAIQKQLFVDLNVDEEALVKILEHNSKADIDSLAMDLQWPFTKLSSVLLGMEMKGLLKALPGKKYQLL